MIISQMKIAKIDEIPKISLILSHSQCKPQCSLQRKTPQGKNLAKFLTLRPKKN